MPLRHVPNKQVPSKEQHSERSPETNHVGAEGALQGVGLDSIPILTSPPELNGDC